MTAGDRLVAALLARLEGDAGLKPLRVFDYQPARVGYPFAVIGQPSLLAEDAVAVVARIGSVEIQCRDGGERPDRLRVLLAAIEEAVETLPDDIGGGWRITMLKLARNQMRAVKDGWVASTLWGVRVFRVS